MGPKRCQMRHLGLFSSSLPPTIVILIALSIVQLWWSWRSFLWLWSLCGGRCVVVVCCNGPQSSWLPWVVV